MAARLTFKSAFGLAGVRKVRVDLCQPHGYGARRALGVPKIRFTRVGVELAHALPVLLQAGARCLSVTDAWTLPLPVMAELNIEWQPRLPVS